MTITFTDLVGAQTVEDVRSAVKAAAAAVAWPVTSLPPLARLRKLALDVVPVLLQAQTRVQQEAIRGGLLDFARGIWLDALAENVFGLSRIGETFATTPVTLTNGGSNNYLFAAGEVQVGNGVVVYTNLEPLTLGPLGSVSGDFICTAIGSAGNADPGDIDTMVTTFSGVTCTNPGAARGNDREPDDELRARCRASRAAMSPAGAADAYRFLALSAARLDGSSIGVTRVQVVEDVPSMGDVAVYLADGDGPPAGADVTRIDALMRQLVVPVGVNFLGALGVTPVTVPVNYTAIARAGDGLTSDEIKAVVATALGDLFATYPIGGYITPSSTPDGLLFRTEIQSVISQAQGAADDPRPIINVTLAAPASDVTLNPGEVPVLGTITASVTLI